MLYRTRHKQLKVYLYNNHDNTTVCQHHSSIMAVNMVCHSIANIHPIHLRTCFQKI